MEITHIRLYISRVYPTIGVLQIDKGALTNKFLQRYPIVFGGDIDKPIVGFSVPIPARPNAIPIFKKAYDVPFQLREAVMAEIDKSQNQGVLVRTDFTEWATSLVIRKKNNHMTLNKVTEGDLSLRLKTKCLKGAQCFTI